MAASSKTVMDLLKQPAAKRLKSVSSSPVATPKLVVTTQALLPSFSSPDTGDDAVLDAQESTTLSSEQKSRIDFNKALARAKRNLKLCSEKISKSTDQGLRYVKLEELLVEESWLEVLPGKLQKAYARNLCKFVENEIRGSGVPIYPPRHLIFNALNTTPFDRVKAVIIGQDPYHGAGQAMGLSFSVPNGVKVSSSLVNIYKELQQDLGCSIPSHGNLERWAVQVPELYFYHFGCDIHGLDPVANLGSTTPNTCLELLKTESGSQAINKDLYGCLILSR